VTNISEDPTQRYSKAGHGQPETDPSICGIYPPDDNLVKSG